MAAEVGFYVQFLVEFSTSPQSHWTKSNQNLLRCNPRSWFIEPSFLVIRWMWTTFLTFLFLRCCSRSTTIAFRCTWCQVVCACSATADLSKRPNLVSDLCSLTLCTAVLRVSPTYTFLQSQHPVPYTTPGISSSFCVSFTPFMIDH